MSSMLFYKNGEFSKTSVLLILGFIIVAAKYFLGGMVIMDIHFPEFNPASALAFFGTVAALYYSNHNIQLKLDRPEKQPCVPLNLPPGYNPPSEKKPEQHYSFTTFDKELK